MVNVKRALNNLSMQRREWKGGKNEGKGTEGMNIDISEESKKQTDKPGLK